MKIKLLYIILIAALSACLKEEPQKSSVNLQSNVWHFKGFNHPLRNMTGDVPGNLKAMDVVFNESGKLHATSSCNVFDGDYTVSGSDSLVVSNLGTTKIYCQDTIVQYWESLYFNGFQNTVKYRILNGSLILTTKYADELIFIPSSTL